jgi:hypothetical protein
MVHDFQVLSAIIPHGVLAMKQYTRFVEDLFQEGSKGAEIVFTEEERRMIKLID